MPRASNRPNGDIIRDFLSVAALLEELQLARLYPSLAREGEATVQEVIDDLELQEGSAYAYVNRLVNAGVIEVIHDEQPRRYVARKIELTVTAAAGDCEYTITPALIDVVGRHQTDDDIDTYDDRHGVAGLGTALTYAVARERGKVTYRLMAKDLDISPLAAESVLRRSGRSFTSTSILRTQVGQLLTSKPLTLPKIVLIWPSSTKVCGQRTTGSTERISRIGHRTLSTTTRLDLDS